jgi:glycosyltransferase involved in cell wall biosynthesis
MSHESNLRVALDATPLLGQRTGIGHLIARLAEALAAGGDLDLTAFAVTWRGRHDLAAALPSGVRPATARFPARLAWALWQRTERPRIEHWTGPVDVVHATNYVAPPTRAATVVSVHDLGFALHPDLMGGDAGHYDELIRRALDRGAHIHTISDTVATQVMERYGLAADRVTRIYPGLSPSAGGDPEAGRRLAGASRYLLAVGTIEPRKDLPTLVRAFDRMAGDHPDVVLCVAGADGWDGGAFDRTVAASHHRDRIRRLGYVPDSDRLDLLAGALGLAYPSIYEGFGFPPLEAMSAGVPVVAARGGSIPEVLGDAALLVTVGDADDLAGALERLVTDPQLRADLVARGTDQAGAYRWDDAAVAFAALYRRVATGATPPVHR